MRTEPWLGKLLQNVEPLPHNVYEYLKIDLLRIDLFSEKAAFLVFMTSKKLTHERWLPFSQIRKDTNGNLWITKWIYNRLKLKQENNCSPQETTMEIIK